MSEHALLTLLMAVVTIATLVLSATVIAPLVSELAVLR